MYTRCPYCKGLLSVADYRGSVECPGCGGSIAAYSRRVQAVLGLVAALFFSFLAYVDLGRNGRWATLPLQHRQMVVAFIGTLVFATALAYVLDWLLEHVMERRGSWLAFLLAAAAALVFWFSPTGMSLGQQVLSMLPGS